MLFPAMSTVTDTRGLLELLVDPRGNQTPVEVIHDGATPDGTGTAPWCGHTLDRLSRELDLPGTLYRIRDEPAPDEEADTTWYCALRRPGRSHLLNDPEWIAVAQRVLRAAGLAGATDRRDCRWILVRETLDTVHVVASLVAFHEEPRQVDPALVVAECRDIADALDRYVHLSPAAPDAEKVVLIAAQPDGIATLAGADRQIPQHMNGLGWRPGPQPNGRWYHTPFGAGPREIADLVGVARDRLTAAGYIVRVDAAFARTLPGHAHGRHRPGESVRYRPPFASTSPSTRRHR